MKRLPRCPGLEVAARHGIVAPIKLAPQAAWVRFAKAMTQPLLKNGFLAPLSLDPV
jgi:hypothetical protein